METAITKRKFSGKWHFVIAKEKSVAVPKSIVYHITFWLLYFTFNVLRWGSYFSDYAYSLHSNLIGFPIHIFLAYFHAYYLLPKFISTGKYLRYFVLFSVALVAMFFVKAYANYYLVSPVVWPESYREEQILGFNYIVAVILGELYVVGLTTSIKLTIDWLRYQKKTKQLIKKNLETELDLLKSQIQPHFFFNTLNNLYALTLEKSDKAPEIVLKLSELMSYILYQASNTRHVSLLKEVVQMQNYLDLEKLRFGKRLRLNFEMQGEVEEAEIAPLILLPFIENVFKHGVRNQLEELCIEMFLKVEGHELTFVVSNPKPPQVTLSDNLSPLNLVGGVGIKNAKRRLDLLYNGKFELNIQEDKNRYTVELKIPTKPKPNIGISNIETTLPTNQ